MDAYFGQRTRMFACISGEGVALRLPSADGHRAAVLPAATWALSPPAAWARRDREWLQINRPDAADYEKDLELFPRLARVRRQSR